MRRMHRPVTVAVLGGALVILSLESVTRAQQPRANPTAVTLADFRRHVDEYVALRNRLARNHGQLDETKSQAEIAARAAKLAEAIRAARATAKAGDIFTPAVSAILKKLIAADYRRTTPRMRASRMDAQEELPDFKPQANTLYPPTFPLATFPPPLLRVLPKLPDEVEYRIVTKYLILRDIEANLIVDVLPNAIP